jgi:hypothetical protein
MKKPGLRPNVTYLKGVGYQGFRAGWHATLHTTTVGPRSACNTLCIAGERHRCVRCPLYNHVDYELVAGFLHVT